uniref:SFRICE_032738 n=1 Tax=Spodoptera frugiperda TaxID=7108 RepID=A0A2H1VTG6_SPOFR
MIISITLASGFGERRYFLKVTPGNTLEKHSTSAIQIWELTQLTHIKCNNKQTPTFHQLVMQADCTVGAVAGQLAAAQRVAVK